MQVGFAIGRIIVGLFYLFTGVSGLLNLNMMAGYAASKGVPAPMLAVIVSHLLLLLAAVCIFTGWKPVIGVAALVIFYLPVTFMMHNFWAMPDPTMKMTNMTWNAALWMNSACGPIQPISHAAVVGPTIAPIV